MFIVGSVLFILLWGAHSIRILAPIESWIGMGVSRMSIVGVNISIAVQDRLEPFIKNEQTPTQVLEDRIKKLEAENAALTLAKIENEALRQQLKFSQQSKFNIQLANRIGWTTDARRSGFIIDKGKKDGITLSAPVITDNGIFIGKITAAQEATSNVTLVNDSKSKVTVIIAAAVRPTTGVINGQFGLGLMVDLIPMTDPIKVDDIVETSGLQDAIPAGLLIGAISKLNTQSTDLFQTASVQPAVDYTKVRIVSVLLP